MHTFIGINDWEQAQKQKIIVNLEMHLPDETAAETDNIADSVDYKRLKYQIISRVENAKFMLLEKLAKFISDILMEEEKINRVSVEIDKPGALRYADSVSVEICRSRG